MPNIQLTSKDEIKRANQELFNRLKRELRFAQMLRLINEPLSEKMDVALLSDIIPDARLGRHDVKWNPKPAKPDISAITALIARGS